MPTPLPQLQPKPYTPPPALPFKEPLPKTPITFKTPKGVKPGQITYPNRISLPKTAPPAAAGAAAGISAGGAALAVAAAAASVLIFDSPAAAPELMNPPEPSQPVEPPDVPFKGGQSPRVYYRVDYAGQTQNDGFYTGTRYVYGPISTRGNIYSDRPQPEFGYQQYELIFYRGDGTQTSEIIVGQGYVKGRNPIPYTYVVNISRVDNQPDTGGDPPPLNNPSYSNPGNPLGAPQPRPPSAAPAPAPGNPQGQPLPGLLAGPGSAPAPAPNPQPQPFPQPQPQPLPQPQPIGQPQPMPIGQPQPFPFAEPAPPPGLNLAPPPHAPTPAPAPAPNPRPAPIPPAILITPGGNPGPLVFAPNPNTGDPQPIERIEPTPDRSPDPERPPLDDINRILGPMAIAIAAITTLVQPNAIKNAARNATCEAFAPGGCNAPIAQDAANAANNSANNATALSAITAFLQALQTIFLQPILAGVNLINTKLGPVLAGADGISGFLGRLSKSLGIDRALNLIGIASNLHNAMMLSASLKITLLEMLSSVGNATGLLQTSENENVDLNAVFNQGIETFMVTIMGAENYAGLKIELRKYNAIYRAATNSLNATASMFNSIGEAIETAAEYTGKIGNALRAASVVRENAYNFMSERITVKTSRFMTFQSKVGDVTQVLETINEIAENVVEGQQQYTEAVKATQEFKKALADADRPEAIDNKLIKAETEKIKANLITDPTGEDETGLLSFLTNQ